jgi:uncharacterized membrane protein YeaQ/YmgE (transglycosylase-associated protein family)
MAMDVFSWIVIGFVTGLLAKVVMPGPRAGGMLVAVLIGLFGALIGGFLSTIFLQEASNSFHVISLMMAVNGAVYPLFIYRALALRLSGIAEED